jgi:hypothetical protein
MKEILRFSLIRHQYGEIIFLPPMLPAIPFILSFSFAGFASFCNSLALVAEPGKVYWICVVGIEISSVGQ